MYFTGMDLFRKGCPKKITADYLFIAACYATALGQKLDAAELFEEVNAFFPGFNPARRKLVPDASRELDRFSRRHPGVSWERIHERLSEQYQASAPARRRPEPNNSEYVP